MVAGEVMTSMEQGNQTTNITAALEDLSPLLNGAWRTVIQIEVFMSVATMLLIVQLTFGFARRLTNNSFIQGGLWLAYTLLPSLVNYTLGLMQSSLVKSGLYPVWASSLLVVAGGANSIAAYDLDDNKQWKRGMFDLLQYFYVDLLGQLLYPGSTKSYFLGNAASFKPVLLPQSVIVYPIQILAAIVLYANLFGVLAGWMANNFFLSKVVADYMKRHADTIGDSQGLDPVSMKGCKYLVWWGRLKSAHEATQSGTSPVYRAELQEKDVITVEKIWEKCDQAMPISHGVRSRIKGVCLSYSLSLLLRRRFFGMDCAEASLPETHKFVFEGLLSENNCDENMDAFRVVEVELGFLYDFFFTKYCFIFSTEIIFLCLVILKTTMAFVLGVILLFKSPIVMTPNPTIKVDTRTTDTAITVVVLGIFLVVEILQSLLYLGSDWAMVSLACNYVNGKSRSFIPFRLRETLGLLSRRPLFSYWPNKIGQYSVIEGSQFFIPMKAYSESKCQLLFLCSHIADNVIRSLKGVRRSYFVKLPDMLKPQIISTLKSSNDHLTNGETSLRSNGLFELFSWALQNETETEKMLVWHIATDYCEIAWKESEESAGLSEVGKKKPSSSQKVATNLSRYCAYLMFNVPGLLPGNHADTRFVFRRVATEAREALGTETRSRDVLQEAITRSTDENTIFARGLKLGQQLDSLEENLRWKAMAEFWAETILYIAPSDNAKAHMERLAKGGEFLTHIWALLTHAGILTRPSKPTPNSDPEEAIG